MSLRMIKPALGLVLTAMVLAACGQGGTESSAAAANEPAMPESPKPKASATSGSIDVAITAETINRNARGDANSYQCQLSFVASNNSREDVASLMIEFDALPAGGGEPVTKKLNLTMPMLIKAGASEPAGGPVVVDNHRCDGLQLSIPAQPSFYCRTRSKAPCADYRYSTSGVSITVAQ